MARLREYNVWTPSPRSAHVSLQPPGRGWYEDRRSQWWLVVKAYSAAQAMRLARDRTMSKDGGPGIAKVRAPLHPADRTV